MPVKTDKQLNIFGDSIDVKKIYEEDKKTNKDHVATPRWVVENIYDIIDERRLQEMEEVKKENELFKVIYSQGTISGKFDIISYHTPLLEYIYRNDKSTYLAIKNTVIQSFENIEKKIKEESKWVKKKKKKNQLL